MRQQNTPCSSIRDTLSMTKILSICTKHLNSKPLDLLHLMTSPSLYLNHLQKHVPFQFLSNQDPKKKPIKSKHKKKSTFSSISHLISSHLLSMKFNNLHKDIIFDIFSRIPIKSLYQITSVCKKWQYLLVLSQEFRDFYHKKHKTNPLLLFKQQNDENSTTQLSSYYIDGTQIHQFPTNFPQNLTSILASNGILCLISEIEVILYDPIIKRVSKLPNSSHFSSTFSWAFGFSPCGKDFIVLHFYTNGKFDNYHYCQVKEVMCEIITYPSSQIGLISQKDWKFLGKCPFDVLGRKDYAYVDGKIYWLIGEINPNCVKIMSFNLENEIFGMVSFPKTYSNSSIECLNLIEIKEKLCLSERLIYGSTMNVWMMIKEEEGFPNLWEKKYKIDLMGIRHHGVKILGHLSKICVNGCESEGEILMKFGEQSFGLYELESQVFRDLSLGIEMYGCNLELMVDRKLLL